MDASGIVVAFADSPAVRETLAVLLEHDCDVRCLPPQALATSVALSADLALVATLHPGGLARDLRRLRPSLPIVAVDVAMRGATVSARGVVDGLQDLGVPSVPLDPHAIRSAVLDRLVPDADAELRSLAQVVAETLRAELAYAFTALRTFSTPPAVTADPAIAVLLGTIMREQSHVVQTALTQLEEFAARPRSPEFSRQFLAHLGDEIERPDEVTAVRGLLCHCTIDAAAGPPGPVGLVPLLAVLLRAHLRRRTEVPVVSVRVTAAGVAMSYPRRRAGALASASWPLLLASLALQPWSWTVRSAAVDDDHETIQLCPAG